MNFFWYWDQLIAETFELARTPYDLWKLYYYGDKTWT